MISSWLAPHAARLDARMVRRFGDDIWPAGFGPALRWPIEAGGKRFRPALVWAAAEAVAGPGAAPSADFAAEAVELVHTYSLVHDDLPAMDDDDERRGRPTVHKAFDEATAILVGDGLLTEAFACLAVAGVPADRVVAMMAVLVREAGVHGMVGGQMADLHPGEDTLDRVLAIHARKTGALIRASVVLGGLAVGGDQATIDALTAYGTDVGLAFQLADDWLDADDAGPNAGRHLGRDPLRALALQTADRAVAHVAHLAHPDRLRELARAAVERVS